MTTALSAVPSASSLDLTSIERVIVAGDLSKLSSQERWNYYKSVCKSVGLNPFTQPFMYITLSGKLVLYATKGASEQLRSLHHISITQPNVEMTDGLCIVTVMASDHTGRTDSELGIVPIENLRGDAKANAILKAVTKAKRRVTLSMCGLGMLDETEVDTIPNARRVDIAPVPEELGADVTVVDGEVVPVGMDAAPTPIRQQPTAEVIQPTPPEEERARAMVEQTADEGRSPEDERLRLGLEKQYTRLAALAVARGHKEAAKIKTKQAKDLSDAVLAGSVAALQAWEAKLPPVEVAADDSDAPF